MGRLIALYVVTRVSFCCPQDVPERAFRMLFLLLERAAVCSICCLNVNFVSKVTPRIFGVVCRGMGVPFTTICGACLASADWGVKRVTEDLDEERWKN